MQPPFHQLDWGLPKWAGANASHATAHTLICSSTIMGFETADGQNGGPRSVQAHDPPPSLCASVGLPGSECQRAHPFSSLEGYLCVGWQGLGTAICGAGVVEVSVCGYYPAANQHSVQTSACFARGKWNWRGKKEVDVLGMSADVLWLVDFWQEPKSIKKATRTLITCGLYSYRASIDVQTTQCT